ncbi:MAG: penicillin-binding protein 2 [Bacteroidales bacterium]|nr:penicillin-binding protein 2 [Bacteroidales bacterium]
MPVNNQNSDKQWVIGGIFIVLVLIFLIRLFYIQVWDNAYQLTAESNSQRHVTQYPARGLILDRNGKVLVQNQAAYDLMVVPKQVQEFDTLEFCKMLSITNKELKEKLKKAKLYSWYKPSIFLKQVSFEDYATFQEHLFRFPGFFVQTRTLRDYPMPTATHLLGYVGEVSEKQIENNSYYNLGDYIGISGIEKTYEQELRGTKGNKIFLVDVHNRIKGEFRDGDFDIMAIPGYNITTTIDAELQLFGEQLMEYKIGSIVAIEPSTGEILALISAPSYNPAMLVGRARSLNYSHLQNDSLKPLFNRALTAQYPPGSIFKIINGLIGLQGQFINWHTHFTCDKSLVGCHNHPTNDNIEKAIQFSCNPYFFQTYKKIIQQGKDNNRFIDSRYGLTYWRNYVLEFGLGKKLKSDLPNISSGSIPDTTFYDKWYGKERWAFSNIASNSIGQGEVMVVPIQMANLVAIIANKGYYITPHVVKKVGEKTNANPEFLTIHPTSIDTKWFETVQNAMYAVVNEAHGTAGRARIDSIAVCGKTGTVQNPHGEDHSVFIAFAPKDNPQIAIAVYVENSGFGGTWAAPIASLMIEKYINGEISEYNTKYKQQRILDYKPLYVEPSK